MGKIEVFEVVKPQGIKGELKVRILADGFDNVSHLKSIFDTSGKEYKVKGIKNAQNGFAFLSIDGILSRNDAELCRGIIYFADKTLIKKSKNSYFIADLIGVQIICDNQFFGTITDVLQSNVDMLKITSNVGKIAYVPFLKALKPQIDLSKKIMVVDGVKLQEVIYYES